MANYPVNKIRNVCLMGHGGDGKTSLVESLLNIAGVTDRVGKIADGNTVCDFDPEEIKRKFSISTAVAPVEWNGCKINLLDTPGFFDFESEVQCALRVAESALIVVTGKSGPGVGTEKAWAHCEEHAMPRMFYISKIDEENSDYYNSLHKLQKQSLSRFLRATAIPSALWTALSARRTAWKATSVSRSRSRTT